MPPTTQITAGPPALTTETGAAVTANPSDNAGHRVRTRDRAGN